MKYKTVLPLLLISFSFFFGQGVESRPLDTKTPAQVAGAFA
jgi:hypothetical protein